MRISQAEVSHVRRNDENSGRYGEKNRECREKYGDIKFITGNENGKCVARDVAEIKTNVEGKIEAVNSEITGLRLL